MATLTIDDSQARRIYKTAAPELKEILENSYSNEGEVLSYKNPNQKKWRVWVEWDGTGFRLNGVSFGHANALSGLGSRAAFASEEGARHFAKYAMNLITESLS